MIASTFSDKSIRDSLNKRLGEIITEIIGDARVQELFEKAGKHPDEYKNQPTGDIALKLGVITKETKTALLVGQAAERTARLAEDVLSGNFQLPYVKWNDPVFKFVGSQNDPEILRFAQSTWMAAQMLHNMANDRIMHPVEENDYAFCFKSAASALYLASADLLRREGQADAANKLEGVSRSLSGHAPWGCTPSIAMLKYQAALESPTYRENLKQLAEHFGEPYDAVEVDAMSKRMAALAESIRTPVATATRPAVQNGTKPQDYTPIG